MKKKTTVWNKANATGQRDKGALNEKRVVGGGGGENSRRKRATKPINARHQTGDVLFNNMENRCVAADIYPVEFIPLS